MFGKLFQRSSSKRPDDQFGLLSLCKKANLSSHADSILKACRGAVEVRLDEFNTELPHTASRLGGRPALPDDFQWPTTQSGSPMIFLGQLTCQELRLAKYQGGPDEGLMSIFLDTLDEQPKEAQVYHFSLKRDLIRRAPPGEDHEENQSYRPGFRAIPSLPALDSENFEQLGIERDSREDYGELLDLLSERGDPTSLQVGGYPPFWDSGDSESIDGMPGYQFFLSLHDIEELSIGWEPSGTVFLWIPEEGVTQAEISTKLSWQICDDDEDWDDDDDED